MYCPKCRAYYNNELAEACECHVALVDELPEDEAASPQPPLETLHSQPPLEFEHLDDDSVVVLTTSDQTEILLVRSMLDEAGIRYLVQGEGIRNLFGLGGLTPVNPITGPIKLRVEAGRAEEAKALLNARDVESD